MDEKTVTVEEIDPEVFEETESSTGEEEDEGDNSWEDWNSEEGEAESDLLCLFCDSTFRSSNDLFRHCTSDHCLDFQAVKRALGLDFYGCFKLINYIRSQVAVHKCWSCQKDLQCRKDLLAHLHTSYDFDKSLPFAWEDERYLKPFLPNDPLLHNFAIDNYEEEDELIESIDKEDLLKELGLVDNMEICGGNGTCPGSTSGSSHVANGSGVYGVNGILKNNSGPRNNESANIISSEQSGAPCSEVKDKRTKVSFASVAAKELKSVNDSYFGSYGTFGIHREMLSDKVRMDAYGGAILKNPSLINQATVMDVGCGTGILSLFAAKAGASCVIAVEASEKMAGLAKQIAKENGLLFENMEGDDGNQPGVVKVVHAMVEDLDGILQIPHHSVDVLISEWMGYCLLFESMLSSVLYARDRWLKPGGAILPDTATIYVAGFGKGATSLPFWENVHGFNMSAIGKEVYEDATQVPIVDVIDTNDIVTKSAVLKAFDLATMMHDEVDFTASVDLELRSSISKDPKDNLIWCHGVILWFDTGFTGRFCKETPTVLSTSPYSPKTHWSQTFLTFVEPVAMSLLSKCVLNSTTAIGTSENPAEKIATRISIARASVHRSIDISLEVMGISASGRKHRFPVQIFNL